MKLLLLIFLLVYYQEKLQRCINQHSILFIASQFNGPPLFSARTFSFSSPGIDNSPLRNLLYYYPPNLHQGHVVARLGESIIVVFQQAYEINTVRFWMWNIDGRQTDLQVLIIAADRKTEKVIYNGNAQTILLQIQKYFPFLMQFESIFKIIKQTKPSTLFDYQQSFKQQKLSHIQ